MAELTNEGYLNCLCDIKMKLTNFIALVEHGMKSYFPDIAGKLRILYCYKSGTESLIKTISDLYNLEIKVCVLYTFKEKAEKGKLPAFIRNAQPLYHQVNSAMNWFHPEESDEIVSIIDAINRKEILYLGEEYSCKRIIEVVADKMGGMHFDKHVNDIDLALHGKEIRIGNFSVAEMTLHSVAIASIELIDMIEYVISSGVSNEFVKIRI
jgi:hypothetical protein